MATLEQQVADLKKQGASIQEALGELNKPDHSKLRPHAGENTLGYWMPQEGRNVLKTRIRPDGKYRALPSGLPKGYKNDAFPTASSFYQGLIKSARGMDPDFSKKYASVAKAIQGMSTQVSAEGGAFILPEFSQQIIDYTYTNDLWSRTNGFTLAGNNMTFKANAETARTDGNRHGGLRGYWTAEGGSITSSMPRTRDVVCRLNDLAVLVYLTNDLIEDGGPALEQYVTEKAAQEFEFMLGDAVINGSGVGQPLGILNSPAILSITKEDGQAASTIVTENIDKMWARRLAGGSYAWYHNQDCGPQLDALVQEIGTGGAALNRPNGVAGEMAQMLKTAPRVETEFNATLGTAGDILLADLGQYYTVSKGGINQAVSIHVQFVTNQTALRFVMRVDGRPGWVSPITPYKGSNTQSFFLDVAARA